MSQWPGTPLSRPDPVWPGTPVEVESDPLAYSRRLVDAVRSTPPRQPPPPPPPAMEVSELVKQYGLDQYGLEVDPNDPFGVRGAAPAIAYPDPNAQARVPRTWLGEAAAAAGRSIVSMPSTAAHAVGSLVVGPEMAAEIAAQMPGAETARELAPSRPDSWANVVGGLPGAVIQGPVGIGMQGYVDTLERTEGNIPAALAGGAVQGAAAMLPLNLAARVPGVIPRLGGAALTGGATELGAEYGTEQIARAAGAEAREIDPLQTFVRGAAMASAIQGVKEGLGTVPVREPAPAPGTIPLAPEGASPPSAPVRAPEVPRATEAGPDLAPTPEEALVRPETPRGTRTMSKADLDAEMRRQADEAEAEVAAERAAAAAATPKVYSAAEAARAVGSREQVEVLESLAAKDARFVEAEIGLADLSESLGDIVKSGEIDRRKVSDYANRQGEAPPVLAISSPSAEGKLFIADGRHRVLAEAARAAQLLGSANAARFRALVPESWARERGLIPEPAPRAGGERPILGLGEEVRDVDGVRGTLIGRTPDGLAIVRMPGGGQRLRPEHELRRLSDLPPPRPRQQPRQPTEIERIIADPNAPIPLMERRGAGDPLPVAGDSTNPADPNAIPLAPIEPGRTIGVEPLRKPGEKEMPFSEVASSARQIPHTTAKITRKVLDENDNVIDHTSTVRYTKEGPPPKAPKLPPIPEGARTRQEKQPRIRPRAVAGEKVVMPPRGPREIVHIKAFDPGPGKKAETIPLAPPTPAEAAARRVDAKPSGDAPPESLALSLWERAKDLFRDPLSEQNPLRPIEAEARAGLGALNLETMRAQKAARQANRLAKELGESMKDRNFQIRLKKAITEGKSDDPRIQKYVDTVRPLIDNTSRELADAMEAVGLKDRAAVVRSNIGKYLVEVPVFATERTMGRLLGRAGLRATQGFNKFRRDAWIVTDKNGRKLVGKFNTEAEAKAVFMDLVNKRGSRRGLAVLEPISEAERLSSFVQDPRALVGKSVADNAHNTMVMRAYRVAADEFGQRAPEGLDAEARAQWARDNDLVPLPYRGTYHALDLYVPKDVAARLEEYTPAPGVLKRWFNAWLGQWKAQSTLASPATWSRDVIGTGLYFSILADAAVTNPKNWPSYAKAAESILKGVDDKVYAEAVRRGLIGTGFARQEIDTLFRDYGKTGGDPLEVVIKMSRKGWGTLGKGYDAKDAFFKLGAIHTYMRRGMSLDDAITKADAHFPNYIRLSKFARWFRDTPVVNTLAPYISFTEQAAKIMARGIRQHPIKAAMLLAWPAMLDAYSRAAIGLTDAEEEVEARGANALTRIMRRFTKPLVPWRDKDGRPMRLDLSYIIPLANEVFFWDNGGAAPNLPVIGSGGPLIEAISEQVSGRDAFTGLELFPRDATTGEEMAARGKAALQTLAPAPPLVKHGATRMRKAADGLSDEQLGYAILGAVGGINIRSPYIKEEVVRKIIKRQIQEGDLDAARATAEAYNRLKPGSAERMKPDVIGQVIRSERSRVVNRAVKALRAGDEAEARRIVDEFNNDPRNKRFGRISLGEAEAEWKKEQARGRTR